MRVALVIPCYNEARNLPALVEKCQPLLKRGHRVVLVDNGSSDATEDILPGLLAHASGITSIRVPHNRGYGYGICQGLASANTTDIDILAWTHADLQTDPCDILRGVELFLDRDPEATFVKGRRRGRPWKDTAFTTGMSLLELALFGAWLPDINAQPTMFGRRFFNRWARPPEDFSLDLFAFWTAYNQGLELRRFDVSFGARLYGTSSWNDGIRGRYKFVRRTASYSMSLRRALSRTTP